MRIVIDMQGAQTESRVRGIGRYTLSFAQALARNRGKHDIILVLSGLFPETIGPIRAAFHQLLPPENVLVWSAPGPVKTEQPDNETLREIAELMREAFITSLQPDVVHISSLFEGHVDDAVTSIGRFDRDIPVSVTLYDLIPLQNPDHYLLPNPLYERHYLRKLEFLHLASMCFAISEFARSEAIEVLKLDESKVLHVPTGFALNSHAYGQNEDLDAADMLAEKFFIHRPFVLYTGASDERKNLGRLIEAFAAMPTGLRAEHQLVFAGRMPASTIGVLKSCAQKAGLKIDDLVFTDYVSDEDLVRLYSCCKLFVFPSWHEGFGLPALEAMACGAPVIASNTSSLPEVVGLSEALFDPFDVEAIASKMTQGLEDESFRQRLRSHGLVQSKTFSWDESARRALAVWEMLQSDGDEAKRAWKKISCTLNDNYQRLIDSVALVLSNTKMTTGKLLPKLALCMESNEKQLDNFLRPLRLPEEITWRIEGPFDSSYSLALVNREVARALDLMGHKVVLHSTEGPGDFSPNEKFLVSNSDLAAMHYLSTDFEPIDSDVVSRCLYPPRVEDMKARFNFLHAYGWEESGFPLKWINSFNASLQGMTVMSEHVRKVMIDHGLTVPISVSLLGVDHWSRIEPDDDYVLKAKSFRFLHVSSCFPRKGADVLLRAYGKAFSASDDVTLVIKTFPNPHNEVYQWLEDARAGHSDYPHVQILEEDYSDEQLKSLYSQCHALVAPSRAEGFGLPMAEAMLSGLAVITTGWSGQTDFCTPETAWLIDYTYARAKTHFALSSSVWAEPNEDHLADLMKEVYLAPADVRDARIAAGSQLLNQNFTWRHTAHRMVKAARACAQGIRAPIPRIGWVTTWNIRCGIATYSEHLISNMPTNVMVLAANSNARTEEDGENVSRCWSVGEHDDLTELSDMVEKLCLDILLIQFNYGFFDLERLANFLTDQASLTRSVVMTMHSTMDPAHVPHKKLSLMASALKHCSRVLVHSPNDMNRLKQLGVVDNVTLFPHGVIDYVPPAVALFHEKRSLTIASYGFFLPHKGLLELIEAVEILRRRGSNIRLNMINAAYPDPLSDEIIAHARRKIEAAGLREIVSLCTDYLSDLESLDMLAKSDLIVLPYQKTGESASGAVRYAIASGRPVAVTPLAIFEDVESAVHFLPGETPEAIADGIDFLRTQILIDSELMKDKKESAQRWRDECVYREVASRLDGMLTSLVLQ